jgi:hypothetical protein
MYLCPIYLGLVLALAIALAKMPEINNMKGRFILAHGFNAWLIGSIAFEPVARQPIVVEARDITLTSP